MHLHSNHLNQGLDISIRLKTSFVFDFLFEIMRINCKNSNPSDIWRLVSNFSASKAVFWFSPGPFPPGSGRTPGCTCTRTSSRAPPSGLSHQRPAEEGSLPASCRQNVNKDTMTRTMTPKLCCQMDNATLFLSVIYYSRKRSFCLFM